MKWSEPHLLEWAGTRKRVIVETAGEERFVLYQTHAMMIPSMWSLFDRVSTALHFLYANGWADARLAAEKRIQEILNADYKPERTPRAVEGGTDRQKGGVHMPIKKKSAKAKVKTTRKPAAKTGRKVSKKTTKKSSKKS